MKIDNISSIKVLDGIYEPLDQEGIFAFPMIIEEECKIYFMESSQETSWEIIPNRMLTEGENAILVLEWIKLILEKGTDLRAMMIWLIKNKYKLYDIKGDCYSPQEVSIKRKKGYMEGKAFMYYKGKQDVILHPVRVAISHDIYGDIW